MNCARSVRFCGGGETPGFFFRDMEVLLSSLLEVINVCHAGIAAAAAAVIPACRRVPISLSRLSPWAGRIAFGPFETLRLASLTYEYGTTAQDAGAFHPTKKLGLKSLFSRARPKGLKSLGQKSLSSRAILPHVYCMTIRWQY